MADGKGKQKQTISDWWDGIRIEFGKIVWPSGQTIYRQTTATVVVSIITALLIVLCDMVIQYGVDKLVEL